MKLEQFQSLPKWLRSNAFFRAKLSNDSSGPDFNKEHVEVHPLDANLISSKKANGNHTLFLDLDQEHFISPSSTPGHSHVYFNTDLSDEALREIIDVLAKHGIVQEGIKKQVHNAGFLTFRPPGVKKGDEYDDADLNKAKLIAPKKPDDGFFAKDVKELSDKFKKLKQKLKAGYLTSSKDIQDAYNEQSSKQLYGAAATGEIFEDTFKNLIKSLGLDYNKLLISNDGFSNIYNITYENKMFCCDEHDNWEDVHRLTFREIDFSKGQYKGITWDKVIDTVKICFGGM